MATKNESIVKIALQYHIEGSSLNESIAKAQAAHKKSNDKSYQASKNSATRQLKMLTELSRKADIKIKRGAVSLQKKADKEELTRLRKQESKKTKVVNEAATKRKKSLAGGFDNFGGKLGTISSYGAAIAIIGALKKAITFVISKMIEFEVAFTDLAVKSGFTNRELSKVSKSVYDVAAATKFSTLEIVSAATALGKLGFEADAVAKILPNVANVAGATGSSLESTAQIFGKVMNAYSLAAKEGLYIADLMVNTFNSSALDMEKFNTAFSYVGAAAASTGTSVTELTVAMGILSDKGVTASKIGTGLRNVFTKLGREGDTLRDIISRVNDENLSFYEIADLVGRRAANQLFILMDSIDDFDTKIADSVNSFGASWEANAKQMSTFSAKWDIFMNNITNKVAGLEFDPDQTFRASLKESIGFMTKLNALRLFNEDATDIAVFNVAAQDIDFLKELKKVKDELKEDGFKGSASEVENEIERRTIASIKSRATSGNVEDTFNASNNRGRKEIMSKMTDEEKQLYRQLKDEVEGVFQFFQLSDSTFSEGDSVVDAIEKLEKGIKEFEASAAIEKWKSSLTNLVSFVSTQKKDFTNEFNDAIREKDMTKAEAVINKIAAEGVDVTAAMKRLVIIQGGVDNITKEVTDKLRDKSDKTSIERLREEGQGYATTSSSLLNEKGKANRAKGKKASITDVFGDDLKRYDKSLADRKAWESRMCAGAASGDSGYSYIVDIEGVVCPAIKGSKTRGGIGRFDKNVKDETEYNEKKASLRERFSNSDNPSEKAGINDQLLILEKDYRKKLNIEYSDYLEEQARLRAAFVKKYPKQTQQFDDNSKRVEVSKIKDASKGKITIDKLEQVEIDANEKNFKAMFGKRKAYDAKISGLNLELKKLDRDDAKGRKKVQDDMNTATKLYFADNLKDINAYYDKIDEKIATYEVSNDTGLTTVSLDKLEDIALKRLGTVSQNQDNENRATKTPSKKDAEDFDYAGASIAAFDEITGLFVQAGEARLQILQQQADRELEIISKRHEEEADIRNSALNAGIISQEDAFAAEERANKRKIDKENKVAKKLFEAQKKQDLQTAIFTGISSTAQAVAQAFANAPHPIAAGIFAAISTAAIAASTAMNLKGISQRKFVPKTYADGGMVHGDSHDRGGVPFTVQGRGGYEMEGGEFIVNKESAKTHLAELERINGKTRTGKRRFALGGTVDSQFASYDGGFNEAILDALNRPVRAYVTDQDLSDSESERNALSKKTSY